MLILTGIGENALPIWSSHATKWAQNEWLRQRTWFCSQYIWALIENAKKPQNQHQTAKFNVLAHATSVKCQQNKNDMCHKQIASEAKQQIATDDMGQTVGALREIMYCVDTSYSCSTFL